MTAPAAAAAGNSLAGDVPALQICRPQKIIGGEVLVSTLNCRLGAKESRPPVLRRLLQPQSGTRPRTPSVAPVPAVAHSGAPAPAPLRRHFLAPLRLPWPVHPLSTLALPPCRIAAPAPHRRPSPGLPPSPQVVSRSPSVAPTRPASGAPALAPIRRPCPVSPPATLTPPPSGAGAVGDSRTQICALPPPLSRRPGPPVSTEMRRPQVRRGPCSRLKADPHVLSPPVPSQPRRLHI